MTCLRRHSLLSWRSYDRSMRGARSWFSSCVKLESGGLAKTFSRESQRDSILSLLFPIRPLGCNNCVEWPCLDPVLTPNLTRTCSLASNKKKPFPVFACVSFFHDVTSVLVAAARLSRERGYRSTYGHASLPICDHSSRLFCLRRGNVLWSLSLSACVNEPVDLAPFLNLRGTFVRRQLPVS